MIKQIKHGFSGNTKFTDWSVQDRTVYGPQLRFEPYVIIAWTVH